MSIRRSFLLLPCVLVLVHCQESTGPAPKDDPDPPVPASVAISPGQVSLHYLGATAQLSVDVRDTAGGEIANATVSWASSDPTIVEVAPDGSARARAPGSSRVSASTGVFADTIDVVVSQVAAAVVVQPSLDTLAFIGDSVRLTGLVADSGGTAIPEITLDWATADTLVVGVRDSGWVRALAPGDAVVQGDFQGLGASATIAVVQVPASMFVTEGPVTIPVGGSAPLVSEVLDAGGVPLAGASATWSSRTPSVAAITAEGLVEAATAGSTWMVAVFGTLTDSVRVEVIQSLSSIRVTPASATAEALGEILTFTAVGLDGSGQQLPGQLAAEWSVVPSAVVVPLDGGRFRAVANGNASVTARFGSAQGNATLTVRQVATQLAVSLARDTLRFLGQTTTATATGEDRRGNAITSVSASWSSSNPSVAAVDGSSGVVRAAGNGEAWISAAVGGLRDSLSVLVQQSPQSVAIAGGNRRLAPGEQVTLSASVLDQGGAPVSGSTIAWASSSPSVADVDAGGKVTAGDVGEARIRAEASSLKDSITITVDTAAAVWTGNATLTSDADLSAFRAGGYVEVTGNLDIWGPFPSGVSLPDLKRDGGKVTFDQIGGVIDLPALARVSGSMKVLLSTNLTAFSAPSVGSLDALELSGVPALAAVDLGALQSVAGTMYIQAPNLTSLDLSALKSGGSLVLSAPITAFPLPSLTSMGALQLASTKLTALNLSGMDLNGLYLAANGSLADVSFDGNLTEFSISGSAALASLSVPGIVQGSFTLDGTGLASLDLPAYSGPGTLKLKNNPNLSSVSVGPSPSFSVLTIQSNPQLAGLPPMRVTSILEIIDNDALSSLGFLLNLGGGLNGRLIVEGNAILTDIAALESLGDTKGSDPIVGGGLRIVDNPALTDAVAQALLDLLEAKYGGSAVSGSVTISGNGG